MPTKLHYDKEHAEIYLGAAMIAYGGALETALKSVAEVKGTDDLQWFDDLAGQMIRDAKGTITEQISVEIEAGALGFGLQSLEANLKGIRRRLIEE